MPTSPKNRIHLINVFSALALLGLAYLWWRTHEEARRPVAEPALLEFSPESRRPGSPGAGEVSDGNAGSVREAALDGEANVSIAGHAQFFPAALLIGTAAQIGSFSVTRFEEPGSRSVPMVPSDVALSISVLTRDGYWFTMPATAAELRDGVTVDLGDLGIERFDFSRKSIAIAAVNGKPFIGLRPDSARLAGTVTFAGVRRLVGPTFGLADGPVDVSYPDALLDGFQLRAWGHPLNGAPGHDGGALLRIPMGTLAMRASEGLGSVGVRVSNASLQMAPMGTFPATTLSLAEVVPGPWLLEARSLEDGSLLGSAVACVEPGNVTEWVVERNHFVGLVRGAIVGTHGVPMANHRFALWSTLNPCGGNLPIYLANAGEDGRFEVEGVPYGDWTLLDDVGGAWGPINVAEDVLDLGLMEMTSKVAAQLHILCPDARGVRFLALSQAGHILGTWTVAGGNNAISVPSETDRISLASSTGLTLDTWKRPLGGWVGAVIICDEVFHGGVIDSLYGLAGM